MEDNLRRHEHRKSFFRPFDKARLDRLVDAINHEMLSAALISDSEGLLDHYGRILVKKLREIRNLEVEVYYPNSTEALLNRFNKIRKGTLDIYYMYFLSKQVVL